MGRRGELPLAKAISFALILISALLVLSSDTPELYEQLALELGSCLG